VCCVACVRACELLQARTIVQRPQRNDNPALRFICKLKAENQQLRQQLAHAHQVCMH
jgi:hypothetical protein